MNIDFIFSEDFYNRPLFQNGERICVTETGSFVVIPKESKWNRFKRFMSFQQDPYIHKVHDQLKKIMEQINKGAGLEYSLLKNEVHVHGGKKFICFFDNLRLLRNKLDRVGQLNSFSKLILEIVNIARYFFLQPKIKVKKYAEFQRRRTFTFLPTFLETRRTFSINTYNLAKEVLSLTDEDKKSCIFSAMSSNDPFINEKIQELEKGLRKGIFIDHIYENSVNADIEIIFDSKKKNFLATIQNCRNINYTSKQLAKFKSEKKNIRRLVKTENSEGKIQIKALIWNFNTIKNPNKISEGSIPLILEPNIEYTFYDDNRVITSLTIKRKN